MAPGQIGRLRRQAIGKRRKHPRSPSRRLARGTGSIGWAASPSSVIGPWPQRRGAAGGRTAPISASFAAPAILCAPAPPRRVAGKRAEDLLARAGRRPARLLPAVAHDRDNIDALSAAHRVMHEMRVAREPEMDHGLAEFLANGRSRQCRAPGGAAAETRRVARRRVAARRSDHNPSAPISRDAALVVRTPGRHAIARSTPCACSAKSSTRVPSRSTISGCAFAARSKAACRSARCTIQ